jgi:ATP-dependent Clp protease ATP-binding subunit ClpA
MSKQPARPSSAFADLLLTALREQALGLALQGMEAFEEEMETSHMSSPQLILTFLKSDSGLARGFITRTDRSAESLIAALSDPNQRTEPPAPSSGVDRSTMSQPIKAAMLAARNAATAEGHDQWTLGACLAFLLADPEAVAREVLLTQGIELSPLIQWLRNQPDEVTSQEDMLSRMMRDSREMIYRLQPSFQRQAEAEAAIPRTEAWSNYQQNWAEQHREKPDLVKELQTESPAPAYAWLQKISAVREAARWEAASRHAPAVTLEHLLLALTVDGTDTSALLDHHGLDRSDVRQELEGYCPSFGSSPAYPEDSPPFAMGGAEEPSPSEPFSDLHSLEAMLWHEEQPAVRLLTRLGITQDVVKAARREKHLGPGWRSQRPDLAAGLRYQGKRASDTVNARINAVLNLAEFEARSRGNTETEKDHILLALLSPETETYAWLKQTGADPEAVARAIDATLPRASSGPDFPPRSPGSGLVAFIPEVPFSDLAMFEKLLQSPEPDLGLSSTGLKILRERGITAEAVRAAMPPTRPLVEVMQEELDELTKRRSLEP